MRPGLTSQIFSKKRPTLRDLLADDAFNGAPRAPRKSGAGRKFVTRGDTSPPATLECDLRVAYIHLGDVPTLLVTLHSTF